MRKGQSYANCYYLPVQSQNNTNFWKLCEPLRKTRKFTDAALDRKRGCWKACKILQNTWFSSHACLLWCLYYIGLCLMRCYIMRDFIHSQGTWGTLCSSNWADRWLSVCSLIHRASGEVRTLQCPWKKHCCFSGKLVFSDLAIKCNVSLIFTFQHQFLSWSQ